MSKKHFIKFTKLIAKWFRLINTMQEQAEKEIEDIKAFGFAKEQHFPLSAGDVQKIIFDDLTQLFKVENSKFDKNKFDKALWNEFRRQAN
jgi:hypothetical protein